MASNSKTRSLPSVAVQCNSPAASQQSRAEYIVPSLKYSSRIAEEFSELFRVRRYAPEPEESSDGGPLVVGES